MREQKRILVADIERDPEQPRKHFDEAELLALGQNMKAIGQQVPVIVYAVEQAVGEIRAKYQLADGERRWRAKQLSAEDFVYAVVLSEKPTATGLHIIQMSLEFHKVGLSAMEKSDFLHCIQEENGWSVNDIAANLHRKQPHISRLLGLQRLGLEARKALHEGLIDIERAHVVSMEPDHAKQLELLKAATECSRDELRRKARRVTVEPKVSAAKFTMPGYTISLSGKSIDLPTAVEVLSETVRVLKKSLSQNLTLDSVVRVMKDTAKAK
jgi:ParB family chromosome partitioning protein